MSGSSTDIQATIPTSPLVWLETGEVRTEWRAFFRRLWARTGGSQGGAVGTGTITGVTAGAGLAGGGVNGAVTLSLVIPVTEGRGGTGATTAPQALMNLGALPIAGGTMTGPIVLPNGTLAAPPLAFGAVDGTGISRSANVIVFGVQNTLTLAMFAGSAQFYGNLAMLNNRITQVADATAVSDALNQRTGDARYNPGAWSGFPIDPGWTAVTLRTRLLNNGASVQFDGSASGMLAAGATARLGVLPTAMTPTQQLLRIPAVVVSNLTYGSGMIEIRTDGTVWTNWAIGTTGVSSTVNVSTIYAVN